jgi:hypothetical protein
MAVQFSIESWSSVMASSLPNHHFHNFSRTFPPLHLSNGLQFFIIKRVFGILAACMALISASTNNAWAHQGQSHHEGLINNHIHAGHFGDAHFHHHPGAVILAPPLLSYYPQSAYHSEITVIQATPTAFIVRTRQVIILKFNNAFQDGKKCHWSLLGKMAAIIVCSQ